MGNSFSRVIIDFDNIACAASRQGDELHLLLSSGQSSPSPDRNSSDTQDTPQDTPQDTVQDTAQDTTQNTSEHVAQVPTASTSETNSQDMNTQHAQTISCDDQEAKLNLVMPAHPLTPEQKELMNLLLVQSQSSVPNELGLENNDLPSAGMEIDQPDLDRLNTPRCAHSPLYSDISEADEDQNGHDKNDTYEQVATSQEDEELSSQMESDLKMQNPERAGSPGSSASDLVFVKQEPADDSGVEFVSYASATQYGCKFDIIYESFSKKQRKDLLKLAKNLTKLTKYNNQLRTIKKIKKDLKRFPSRHQMASGPQPSTSQEGQSQSSPEADRHVYANVQVAHPTPDTTTDDTNTHNLRSGERKRDKSHKSKKSKHSPKRK